MPHYDALVLTLCISGFDVHKVLMDPGSAADLLQLPTFNQMNLSLGMLNLAGRILYGLNDATTTTLGDVTLFVQVGPVTQQVLFSFVKDLGPYNAIIGRTWLHSMKIVPSTLIRATVGVPKSTKFISQIPPTSIAKLLQYSDSRVELNDGFSTHK